VTQHLTPHDLAPQVQGNQRAGFKTTAQSQIQPRNPATPHESCAGFKTTAQSQIREPRCQGRLRVDPAAPVEI